MSELMHYGIPRRSGRYPWGSGENPYQSARDFLGRVDEYRAKGMSEVEIAQSLGLSTTALRAKITVANAERTKSDAAQAHRLKEKGYSNVAIAERLGVSEGTVRNLLKDSTKAKADQISSIGGSLREAVESKKYIDIGAGTEIALGISRQRFDAAVNMLKEEGYEVINVQVTQAGTGLKTTIQTLCPPETTYKELKAHLHEIVPLQCYSEDGGATFRKIEPARSIDSNTVRIVYAEQGGEDRDGLIELRRGVPELSLGRADYAQVRIAVDGTHYLKGMAVYADDLPEGVNVRFNTNKHEGTPMMGDKDNTVLKVMKPDPQNPFGAAIKLDDQLILAQRHYTDADGKEQLSAINIVNEEGNWKSWASTISSQFLSKQDPKVAKDQLDIDYASREAEYQDILSVTNPTVRKKLLQDFSDSCDGAAVHLKAAAFPRQSTNVIIPFPSLKENEIYAPNYEDGEKVQLVRYPHAGRFECPVLTVNNKNKDAKNTLGNAVDAVGINAAAARQLSGADFDGDHAIVIPLRNANVKAESPIDSLKDFSPTESYPKYENMKIIPHKQQQLEMGIVSNLITDMQLQGADREEIARAVRHSMVIIDAEKHELNWKQSAIDNNISELHKKYQGNPKGGAATLISRASGEANIDYREEGQKVLNSKGKLVKRYINPETGEKLYTSYPDATRSMPKTKDPETGEVLEWQQVKKTTKTTKMNAALTSGKGAESLSSGTRIEQVYAQYADNVYALANRARKEMINTPNSTYSPTANKAYKEEVASIKAKLTLAKSNAPLERRAQIVADSMVKAAIAADPSLSAEKIKKLRGQSITIARTNVGAGKHRVELTKKEVQAIQAGAISSNMLSEILANSDTKKIREAFAPKTKYGISDAKEARIRSLANKGYTQAEIARQLGVSTSTVNNVLH